MGRNVAAGVTAGLTTGIAAWVAAPFVSMARRGTVDDRTRPARTGADVPAPAIEDPRIARARQRAAVVASIPAPRAPHPSEMGVDLAGADIVIPAARRSPRR